MILFVVVSSVLVLQAASAAPLNENEPELLVAATTGVYRMPFDGNNTVLIADAVNATSVDYHHAKRLLFWSDVATHKIYSKDLFDDSSEIKTVVAGPSDWEPRAIAVDYINDKIYVMDQGGLKIDVFELDGSKMITGIRVNLTDPDLHPSKILKQGPSTMDIAVDPNEGVLFYGDNDQVMRATLDFSSVERICKRSWYSGLTIDREEKYFYVADKDRFLWKTNYNGQDIDHFNAYDHPSELVKGTPMSPRSLSKYYQNYFFLDTRDNILPGINKMWRYYDKPVNAEIKMTWTVRVRHSSLQSMDGVKDYAKGCEKADCKYMCLASNPAYSNVTHTCFSETKQ